MILETYSGSDEAHLGNHATYLALGKGALTPEARTLNFGLVQEKVMREHLWMPVLNIDMYMVTNKRLKGARAHTLYQNVFYKGLDLSF